MHHQTYNVIVEEGIDGFLISSVIELPGCHTQAKTYDELVSRTKEAIELYVEDENILNQKAVLSGYSKLPYDMSKIPYSRLRSL